MTFAQIIPKNFYLPSLLQLLIATREKVPPPRSQCQPVPFGVKIRKRARETDENLTEKTKGDERWRKREGNKKVKYVQIGNN